MSDSLLSAYVKVAEQSDRIRINVIHLVERNSEQFYSNDNHVCKASRNHGTSTECLEKNQN